MDLSVRQKIQQAFQDAVEARGSVVIEKTDGTSTRIEPHLVSYEMHIEATAQDGTGVTIPYEQIADAHA